MDSSQVRDWNVLMALDYDIEKTTVNLRRGDMDFLKDIGRARGIPASLILRRIISEWIDARKTESSLNDI